MHDERQETEAADGHAGRWGSPTTRKSFLKGAAVAGVGASGLGALAPALAMADSEDPKAYLTARDVNILKTAQIAEALAVSMYSGIIETAPFFKAIEPSSQEYFTAALQEEMSHYLVEESLTRQPSAVSTFYFPMGMFSNAQTTLNTLVTLEEAFIAAYLIGVRQFSTDNLKVTAARIMGIESDHRVLARVVGPEVPTGEGGPIESITGIQGVAESVNPANNNGYERTLSLKNIKEAAAALAPFINKASAEAAGFDTANPRQFVPFTPTLPTPLGDFNSFQG
jgi:hypothetical protein